jgi:hypothetical protein
VLLAALTAAAGCVAGPFLQRVRFFKEFEMGFKVKLLGGFAGPKGVFDRGDVIEVEEAEARRLVALNMATAETPLPKGKPADEELARRERVEVVQINHDENGLETSVAVRPARPPKRGERFRLPPIKTPTGFVEVNDEPR